MRQIPIRLANAPLVGAPSLVAGDAIVGERP
jgi:hypothetical protein